MTTTGVPLTIQIFLEGVSSQSCVIPILCRVVCGIAVDIAIGRGNADLYGVVLHKYTDEDGQRAHHYHLQRQPHNYSVRLCSVLEHKLQQHGTSSMSLLSCIFCQFLQLFFGKKNLFENFFSVLLPLGVRVCQNVFVCGCVCAVCVFELLMSKYMCVLDQSALRAMHCTLGTSNIHYSYYWYYYCVCYAWTQWWWQCTNNNLQQWAHDYTTVDGSFLFYMYTM